VSSSLHLGSAVTAAFLASLVEAVEALAIVLAAAIIRGWRPAGLGALAGFAVLAMMVVQAHFRLEQFPLPVRLRHGCEQPKAGTTMNHHFCPIFGSTAYLGE
jgi:hypothetical protein